VASKNESSRVTARRKKSRHRSACAGPTRSNPALRKSNFGNFYGDVVWRRERGIVASRPARCTELHLVAGGPRVRIALPPAVQEYVHLRDRYLRPHRPLSKVLALRPGHVDRLLSHSLKIRRVIRATLYSGKRTIKDRVSNSILEMAEVHVCMSKHSVEAHSSRARQTEAKNSSRSGSQETRRWREKDSNPRSPVGTAFFSKSVPEPGDDKPAQ
jgi:hypothetical protein